MCFKSMAKKLNAWCRVILERSIVPRQSWNAVFYGSRRFTTVIAWACIFPHLNCNLYLYCIQSTCHKNFQYKIWWKCCYTYLIIIHLAHNFCIRFVVSAKMDPVSGRMHRVCLHDEVTTEWSVPVPIVPRIRAHVQNWLSIHNCWSVRSINEAVNRRSLFRGGGWMSMLSGITGSHHRACRRGSEAERWK
jgi:hypothetical protein